MAQNKIRVDTGAVTIEVNDKGETITFVTDVLFVDRFQSLYDEIDSVSDRFKEQEADLLKNSDEDENGLPVNMRERTALIKEVCTYCEGKIDDLFGEGTCRKALGGAMHPDFYASLLEQLLPFIGAERAKKTAEYKKPKRTK